jgi:hypothetical protein
MGMGAGDVVPEFLIAAGMMADPFGIGLPFL